MKTERASDLKRRFTAWLEAGNDGLDRQLEQSLKDTLPETEEERPLKVLHPREAAVYRRIETWGRVRGEKLSKFLYALLASCVCAALILLMLSTVTQLPQFGSADTLIDSEVSSFYVEETMKDTGAMNIVTGIILDYRGFDTLGESHVLFIAVCSVLILLRVRSQKDGETTREKLDSEVNDRNFEPKNDVILQTGARILVPIVFLFGIYVLLNGHLSPGGGFSGGTVMGAGLILYLNAFGFKSTERFFTFRIFQRISYAALTFYAFSKGYHFFCGANGLASGISPGIPGRIFSAGLLLPLNVAVGCVVACTMYAMYTLFRKGDL